MFVESQNSCSQQSSEPDVPVADLQPNSKVVYWTVAMTLTKAEEQEAAFSHEVCSNWLD